MNIAHDFAEVNGVRLHYASAGTPGAPLVLFLHGFPEFWYAWRKQLTEFGGAYYAVAPDMRGYNLSGKPEGVDAYKMTHLRRDVLELARHLGYETFHLAGHDWGGVVAWAYALAFPETLRRLIILNAPHPAIFERELRSNPWQIQASQYIDFFRTPGSEAAVLSGGWLERALLRPCLAKGWMTEQDAAEYRRSWAVEGALTAALNYYRASHFHPRREEEPAPPIDKEKWQVRVPTLVIWGMADKALLPSNLDGLDGVVEHLTVHRLAGASHWLIHEEPGEVNRLIRDFLSKAT